MSNEATKKRVSRVREKGRHRSRPRDLARAAKRANAFCGRELGSKPLFLRIAQPHQPLSHRELPRVTIATARIAPARHVTEDSPAPGLLADVLNRRKATREHTAEV